MNIATFYCYIRGDELMLASNMVVDVSKFQELFAEVVNDSYATYVQIDELNNYGYKSFFDRCKAEGILT